MVKIKILAENGQKKQGEICKFVAFFGKNDQKICKTCQKSLKTGEKIFICGHCKALFHVDCVYSYVHNVHKERGLCSHPIDFDVIKAEVRLK